MPVLRFPDPRDTGPEGLLALGGDLGPETLFQAYKQGIFPWPIEGAPALTWFCPPERAILEFKDLHLSRSLTTFLKKHPYRLTYDHAFDQVIAACALKPRPGQPGTWITPLMQKAYVEFHRRGHAHSVEVWENQELVGGIYGVEVEGAFAGESMFHHKPNASKLALLHLIDCLRARGIDWIDIQVMTPHMEKLGAKLISRDDFLMKLEQTHAKFREHL